ncbi:MAG: 3-hydroxyacyl-ACP dehydratase FabZ [Lachnospiraceae bacterium]|jgi:3-hydroxyacyl-[acyl-carrier-protein] dehydratase|nr:3-hydroxyacyl-ACP dehydratase FabZ [Lachnospiraceae bacterium]
MAIMNAKEIMEIIPHRQPFMLLDTVEELEPGLKATAKKCVTYNEPFFAGHFPTEPVMPGVLIIEALAQTGAVALLSSPDYKGRSVYFGAIRSAKFKGKVVPGDVLILKTEITRIKGPFGFGNAIAYVNEKVVAVAEITFAIGNAN